MASNGVSVFKGIPYAAPPVGPLRWKPPQPPAAWGGTKMATSFGNDCIQQTPVAGSQAPGISEDCLYLNVWTPSTTPGKLLPVDVWIYGGAYIGGSSADSLFNGTPYAQNGVVFVSFNYRTGVFGFFSHPGLVAESPHHSSGNYGLMDDLAALSWVKQNIAAFGGDPNQVTVQGESAGASSIQYLIASPLAKGLFRSAIMESVGIGWHPLQTEAQQEALGLTVGSNIATLRAMSAQQLAPYTFSDFIPTSLLVPSAGLYEPGGGYPDIDGYVLPTDERHAYANGTENHVAMIVGNNAQEGALFSDGFGITTLAGFQSYVQTQFGSLASQALALYPATTDAQGVSALADVVGDSNFALPAREHSRMMSQVVPNVYRYLFTKQAANNTALPPVTHGGELPYVFGQLSAQPGGPPVTYDATDQATSAAIMGEFINFIKTQNPNGGLVTNWPAYNTTDPYLQFGNAGNLPGTAWHNAQFDLDLQLLATCGC
jgi:para-nitrobenzyl esterase